MKPSIKYLSLGGALVVLVLGIYSCNKTKSDGQTSTSETIASSYSVSVISAAKKDLTDSFSQVGTIVAYNDVAVMSETSGRVVKVDAEVGDYKKAGSVRRQIPGRLLS